MWEYDDGVAIREGMMALVHMTVHRCTSSRGNELGHNSMLYAKSGTMQKILKRRQQKDKNLN